MSNYQKKIVKPKIDDVTSSVWEILKNTPVVVTQGINTVTTSHIIDNVPKTAGHTDAQNVLDQILTIAPLEGPPQFVQGANAMLDHIKNLINALPKKTEIIQYPSNFINTFYDEATPMDKDWYTKINNKSSTLTASAVVKDVNPCEEILKQSGEIPKENAFSSFLLDPVNNHVDYWNVYYDMVKNSPQKPAKPGVYVSDT